MKKIILLVCVLALLVLAGCGAGKTELTENDLSLTVGGTEITVQSDVSDLLDTFGADYSYTEAVSCVYDGMDKAYTYADFTLYTYPSEQGDCLMEIYCTGTDTVTAKGIGIGAPKELIMEVYGEEYVEKGATVVYELPLEQADCVPASLYFYIENDCVSAIGMTTEHRME
ncbi:MAG: hypothetical protein IIV87_05580 [Oscillospiraceae bacterium]|nr:hypothetical protein [Oscillospiraceae bacterium]